MTGKGKNPFKEMERSLLEVPPGLKKKVMKNIAMAKLVMDMASLFSTNYSSALENLFKTRK
ncbi:hypothetical protein [Spongiimicrobium sp. 3-5]|uniref:hypothetical protein n=1 Tax=Spongiimicrobium sp. 3-5 TaxID=3332596 RepID=UPI00397F6182